MKYCWTEQNRNKRCCHFGVGCLQVGFSNGLNVSSNVFNTNCEKDSLIYVSDNHTVLLMFSVNTDFKLSALGPSGSFVWVALYLFTTKTNHRLLAPWHRGYRMWCRKCHSPSDGKMIIFSTQQLQLNPTKSSRFQFRRSTAAIADLARARELTP